MQNIEVHDTVQLTALTVMQLAQSNPPLFDDLVKRGTTTANVLEIGPNHLLLDIGTQEPLRIDVPASHFEEAVQLKQKHTPPEPVPVAAAAGEPQAPVCEHGVPHPFAQSIFGMPLQAVMARIPLGPFGGGMPYQQTNDEVPTRVRISQWVMVQFLSLKQYAITQDLNRISDEHARKPDPTGDNWNRNDIRPVQVELAAAEEQLYNKALGALGDWIENDRPQTQQPAVIPQFTIVEMTPPASDDTPPPPPAEAPTE